MFKVIVLAKRKPGMTMDAFQTYYENHHSVSGMATFPYMRKYTRTYLTPIEDEMASSGEPPFDCVTEACFKDEAEYLRMMAHVAAHPEQLAAHAADEENLFDRSKIWWFAAETCESAL